MVENSTTGCEWDSIIPFAALWEQYKRVISDTGAIVLTGSQPFTSMLVASNLEMFKYEWIWDKPRPTGFIHAKNKPLKSHENVLVFSKGTTVHENQSPQRMTYNPQGLKPHGVYTHREGRSQKMSASIAGKRPSHVDGWTQEYTNYPKSIIPFENPNNDTWHPTQKPVALFAYLIRTYTNPGDLVLDSCAGSFTTGAACIQEGRRAILIEKDLTYYERGCQRLRDLTPSLFAEAV